MDALTTISIYLAIKANVKLNISLDINQLIEQFRKSPPLLEAPKDIKIDISEEVKVSDDISVNVSIAQIAARVTATGGTQSVATTQVDSGGSLSMIKTTNNPNQKELELIQAARGNRPYNSISGVQISYDEKGNITSLKWNES